MNAISYTINMKKIKTIQIHIDEDTYKSFNKVKKKWKSKNWNDFVNKLCKKEL